MIPIDTPLFADNRTRRLTTSTNAHTGLHLSSHYGLQRYVDHMMFTEDLKAKARWLYGRDTAGAILRAFLSDATLSLILYRSMALCNRRNWGKPLAFLFCKLNSIICGAVIGLNARFGRRFVILHSVGIVINSSVVAGDDIVIESGVVIGAEKGSSPRLGNNIFLGSGSKIIGEITLGDNIKVGANAVVIRDVASNVTVGGIPAKVLKES